MVWVLGLGVGVRCWGSVLVLGARFSVQLKGAMALTVTGGHQRTVTARRSSRVWEYDGVLVLV